MEGFFKKIVAFSQYLNFRNIVLYLNLQPHPLANADVLYGRPFFCQKFFSRSSQKEKKSHDFID